MGFYLWRYEEEVLGPALILFIPFVVAGGIASLKEKRSFSLIGGIIGLIGVLLWTYHIEKSTGIHYITFAIFHLPFLVLTALVIFFATRIRYSC